MDIKEIEKMLMTDIDNSREKAFEIAQFIFDHPEISRQEYESSEYLAHYLETEGFAVEMPYCGIPTAFKATRKNGSGPRIAFMAEYDALPGMGHACGHHWIASTSLMAGITLAKALDYLEGEVTVFGTPGEETGEGKPYMVDQGAFDGYQAALEIHPQGCTSLELDMIAIGGIDITFTGTASHAGAAPYNGVNALDAVITFFNSVNAMRQQLRDGTRVHGIITEGGTAVNIIPETGKIRIEVRAKEMDYWNEVLERVVKCAEGAALATGCELEWHHFEPTCAGLLINKNLEKTVCGKHEGFSGIRGERRQIRRGSKRRRKCKPGNTYIPPNDEVRRKRRQCSYGGVPGCLTFGLCEGAGDRLYKDTYQNRIAAS